LLSGAYSPLSNIETGTTADIDFVEIVFISGISTSLKSFSNGFFFYYDSYGLA
jgi:hypothetical protein